MSDVKDYAVAAISGGFLSVVWRTVTNALTAHRKKLALIDDAPSRMADSTVQRTQAGMVIMQQVLDAAVARAEAAEATVKDLREEIDKLEATLSAVRLQLETATTRLAEISNRVGDIAGGNS